MTELSTYRIPAENRAGLVKKLDAVNKKAAKLGVAPVSLAFEHDCWEIVTGRRFGIDPLSPEAAMLPEERQEWLRVTLSGDVIRVPDHTFIGTIYHTTEGNILLSVPGHQIPETFRDAKSYCDHCGTDRRRNDTYVVRHNETGALKQVGSNCLQDFFGHDMRRAASWAEIVGAFGEWIASDGGSGSSYREPVWSLLSILQLACVCVRKHNWLSRSKERELLEQYPDSDYRATSSRVSDVLYADLAKDYGRKLVAEYRVMDEDAKLAEEIYNWSQSLDNPDGSDYLGNLQLIVRADTVTGRTLGLAVSLVACYRRAMNIRVERASDEASQFIGTVGERLRDLPVFVVNVVPLPGNEFGPRNLVKMKDESGNVLVWFTGYFSAPEATQKLYMDGTVKDHSTFGKVQQTVVSRCVFTDAPRPPKVKKARKSKSPATSAEGI